MYHFVSALFLVFFGVQLCAQVPVHEEPLHRPVFENDKVRVLDVRIPPRDTSLYHLHHTPSVFIFFTGTGYGSQLTDDAPLEGRFTLGKILYENLAAPNTRIHRVWNTDTAMAHVMDIELLYTDSGFNQPPLTIPALQIAVDTPRARVYRIELEAGDAIDLGQIGRNLVLVSINAASLQVQGKAELRREQFEPGNFFWLNPGDPMIIRNNGTNDAQFALLELPAL